MEDKIFDIITDLLRGDIGKDEAIDLLVELFKNSKNVEQNVGTYNHLNRNNNVRLVKTDGGTYKFLSQGTVLFQNGGKWMVFRGMQEQFTKLYSKAKVIA